jgi:hypothetical protein
MRYLITFLIIGSLIKCTRNHILLEELVIKDGKYFIAEEGIKPFSGIAISKFTNKQASNKISFINGVPNGSWISYGYKGEVIQSGKFEPQVKFIPVVGMIRQVIRVNVCTTVEARNTVIELYIVTHSTQTFDIQRESSAFRGILNHLKSQGITIKNDLIDKIKVVNSEI